MTAPAWKVNKVVAGVLATFVLIYGTVVTSVVSCFRWTARSVLGDLGIKGDTTVVCRSYLG